MRLPCTTDYKHDKKKLFIYNENITISQDCVSSTPSVSMQSNSRLLAKNFEKRIFLFILKITCPASQF